MPSWIEFRLACRGLYRLALFDRSFLGYFDRSTAGVLRSFGLLVPLTPLFLALVWAADDRSVPSIGLYLSAKALAYLYSWILLPFVILTAGRLLERDTDAPGCIAVYNWVSVLLIALQLPATAIVMVGAPGLAQLLNLAVFAISLAIEGFLFVVAMRIALWQAAALVAVDVVLTQAVIWPVSDWLGGVPVG
jgi:hypothetical protein